MKLIIVTGLSGSGKSIALHTLEDLGYNCIDNLPFFLLEVLAHRLLAERETAFERTAVGIDARAARHSLEALPSLMGELKAQGIECRVVFLEAQPDTLIKRFSETRRKHPLTDGDRSLAEAVQLERELLEPVLNSATLRVDTTYTNVHELRDLIRERVEGSGGGVSILLKSFGFKHGVPRDVDFVFDVRCLPNPHWEPELRPYTGRDRQVAEYLEADPDVEEMFGDLSRFAERWIPAFEQDGRSYLTIALGCTGGQHRSVYMVERLQRHLQGLGLKVITRHRELS